MVQTSLSQRRLVTRYLLLYCLFGVIVGVQLGTATWVVAVFEYWPPYSAHFLLAFTMAGLIVGEICGARVTKKYSSSNAVVFAAAAFAISALGSFLAVYLWTHEVNAALSFKFLLVAAFTFGIGLGTQHSSLDAWFSVSTRLTSERGPTDSEMTRGYTTYTLGFFVGQVVFFPLLYNLRWWTTVATTTGNESTPIKMAISATPYLVPLVAAVLIMLLRPYSFPEKDIEPEPGDDQESRHSVAGIFRRGGIAFVMMLIVGSCVSFVIFHIDTFSGPYLLPGSTIAEKTLGVGILAFVTFVMVGLFSWKLDADQRLQTLSPTSRSGVLALNLAFTVVLLGLIVHWNGKFGWFWVAVALGIASGFVNTLPQLAKWAILDCATMGDKASASAILGIAKRVPNLVFSLAVMTINDAEVKSPNFAYKLLIAANVIAIIALAIYYSRVRRYDLSIVYPSDKGVAIADVLAATVSDCPNTTLQALQHLPSTNGKARIYISVYSTSKHYVRQLVRSLRHNRSVSRASLRRSR
jgi:MFS family permease